MKEWSKAEKKKTRGWTQLKEVGWGSMSDWLICHFRLLPYTLVPQLFRIYWTLWGLLDNKVLLSAVINCHSVSSTKLNCWWHSIQITRITKCSETTPRPQGVTKRLWWCKNLLKRAFQVREEVRWGVRISWFCCWKKKSCEWDIMCVLAVKVCQPILRISLDLIP